LSNKKTVEEWRKVILGDKQTDKDNCIMCNKELNLFHHNTYEYDYEGEIWCDSCFQKESDTGE
jgi:hypothetical protein